MNDKINSKTFMRNYGIFLLVLIVIFAAIIFSTKAANQSWKTGLKTSIVNLLNEVEPDTWTVGEYVNINNTMGTNSAFYRCKSSNNDESYLACIIRVSTFYGPMPAVFIVDSNKNVTFKSFTSLHGRIGEMLNGNYSDKRITYWINFIPELIKDVEF